MLHVSTLIPLSLQASLSIHFLIHVENTLVPSYRITTTLPRPEAATKMCQIAETTTPVSIIQANHFTLSLELVSVQFPRQSAGGWLEPVAEVGEQELQRKWGEQRLEE